MKLVPLTSLIAVLGFAHTLRAVADVVEEKQELVPDTLALSIMKTSKPQNTRTYLVKPRDFLERAFTPADFHALMSERGLWGCRDKLARYKQYNSNSLFSNTDCSKNYSQPTAKIDGFLLMKTAGNRAFTRYGYDQLRKNEILRSVIDGKFDFDFSFSDLFSKVPFFNSSEPQPEKMRPVYVLHVGDSANELGLNIQNEAERQIVERWPEAPDQKNAPRPAPEVFQELSYGQRIAKQYGLVHTPFTKFKIKFEKTTPGMSMNLRIRMDELNNLMYADLTSLVFNSDMDGVAYGFRLPYKGHAIGADYANMKADPVAYYSYSKSGKNAKLVYNRTNNAFGLEINMSI